MPSKKEPNSKKTSKADQLTWTEVEVMRHSAAHVLAQAVQQMFPEAKLGVGPPIEQGFYYDFELPRTLIPEDLPLIEEHMKGIMKEKQVFETYTEPTKEALAYLKKVNQPYKMELVEDIGADTVGFAKNGPFVDLCKNPHVENTSKIGHFKLLSIAGAYWKGDSARPMLQRIYAALFETKEELSAYILQQEEAKKRDHRVLGQKLELFTISDLVGSGLPLWMPNGTIVRDELQTYLKKEQVKLGYLPVITPHIGKIDLYKTSGHWQAYRESMYSPIEIDGEEFILKPMNCPHHVQIYKSKMHSYRDLPVRLTEFGTVYRYEKSGVLHGLTRVRGFTQDDAHLFCRPDQVKEEFIKVLKLVLKIFKDLGIKDYSARIGLRDKDKAKYVGSDALWERAEREVEEATEEAGMKYTKEQGEAAFYGPKLDFMVRDSIGREWQLGTIQVDYNLPDRFELEYTGEDGKSHRPVMIHRAPFGSLERFIGILTEHYAGAFPVWLSPVQVVVLPISDKHAEYTRTVYETLLEAGLRATLDESNESIGKRIRNAEKAKTPFMLACGDREAEAGTVAVRTRGETEQSVVSVADFITLVTERIKNKA